MNNERQQVLYAIDGGIFNTPWTDNIVARAKTIGISYILLQTKLIANEIQSTRLISL